MNIKSDGVIAHILLDKMEKEGKDKKKVSKDYTKPSVENFEKLSKQKGLFFSIHDKEVKK